MIYLTRINMLPYRAIVREGKKKEFQKLLLIAAMVALLLSLLVYYSVSYTHLRAHET